MPEVIVLGGGVAGLTAAHELAERGFDVTVLERRHRGGGKARSINVEPTRLGGHPYDAVHPVYTAPAWAPGEHGFRFFPGFYRHVIDTMRRTPSPRGGSVADGLQPTSRVAITQYGRPMFEFPARFPDKPNDALAILQAILVAFSPITELQPEELAHFGARIWQILTSCPERRLTEYEKTRWWTFIGAESAVPRLPEVLGLGHHAISGGSKGVVRQHPDDRGHIRSIDPDPHPTVGGIHRPCFRRPDIARLDRCLAAIADWLRGQVPLGDERDGGPL